MAFDPISWGLGFGSTKLANSLIERTYPSDLPQRLIKEAKKWSEELPPEIYTIPEAIFEFNGTSEFNGEARSKLQAVLYMHTSIPSENIWHNALLETWAEKKKALGSSANGFFIQDKNNSQKYIRKLAKALYRECKKDPALFQVTALGNLATLADKSDSIKHEIIKTRSMIIDHLNRIESFQKSYIPPVNIDTFFKTGKESFTWESISDLNKVLMVDKPTSIIAGRLRENDSWLGNANSSIEEACYVPPVGRELKTKLQIFISKWAEKKIAMTSRDPREIVAGIASFHYELLEIHPFEDGNGSVARAISDSHARTYFSFSDRLGLLEDNDYMDSLKSANAGDLDPLIKIIDKKIFE